jgi:hypothetical protein
MALNKNNDRSKIKDSSDFHPSQENLRHHRTQPAATTVAGMDDRSDPRVGLVKLSTDELRVRARSLALQGSEDMKREELIEALYQYHRNFFENRQTEH